MGKAKLRSFEERQARLDRLIKRLGDLNGTQYQQGALQALTLVVKTPSTLEVADMLMRVKNRVIVADMESETPTYSALISGQLSAFCWALGGEIEEFDSRT